MFFPIYKWVYHLHIVDLLKMNFKKDIAYYHDEMIGTFHYAYAHPMKPLRVAMTNEIVQKYELNSHFDHIVHYFLYRIVNLLKLLIFMLESPHSLLFILMNILI